MLGHSLNRNGFFLSKKYISLTIFFHESIRLFEMFKYCRSINFSKLFGMNEIWFELTSSSFKWIKVERLWISWILFLDNWRKRSDERVFNELRWTSWLLDRSRSIRFLRLRNWFGKSFKWQWEAWNSVRDESELIN